MIVVELGALGKREATHIPVIGVVRQVGNLRSADRVEDGLGNRRLS
jgi:hypothetical protein